jgi:hypothetical protein
VNVLGAGFDERAKPITWLTAQAAYEINSMLRVTFEGRNLLDSVQEYTLGNSAVSLPNGYNRFGRSYTVGLGVRF